MLTRFVTALHFLSPITRRFAWKHSYQLLNRGFQDPDFRFLNYGYAEASEGPSLNLLPQDQVDRPFIALYHVVASPVSFEQKEVLEVGSGRGGGASYLCRYLKPKKYLGIDFSENAIEFCNSNLTFPNLSFRRGDAEALFCETGSFDVVLNVESSHCYGHFDRFVRETFRVLRPGGSFLWADFRTASDFTKVERAIYDVGFEKIEIHDITENVLLALDLAHERKKLAIQTYSPRVLSNDLQQFAALKETEIYQNFNAKRLRYYRLSCRKPQ